MVNRKILIFVFFTIFLEIILYVPSIKADAYVIIGSHDGFLFNEETYYIVGEVENIGTESAYLVIIDATLYDANYTFIAEERGFVIPEMIMPKQKAPFIVSFENASQASKVSKYTLDGSIWDTTLDTRLEGLRILSQSHLIAIDGYMDITGEIKNTGIETSTNTMVYVMCYDVNGTVVYVSLSPDIPVELAAGQQTTYEMLIQPDKAPFIDTCVISAQSEEYLCYDYPTVVIPEFPLFFLVPFFGMFTLLAMILKKTMLRARN